MPITITCPSCAHKLKIKDEFAGRKVRCPRCSEVVRASTPEEPVDAAPPARPPRTPPSPPPVPERHERDDDDLGDDIENTPKAARRPRDDDEPEPAEDVENTPKPVRRHRRDDDEPEPAEEKPSVLRSDVMDTDAGIRVVGLLTIGIGAAAGYFGIYETIIEAQARKPNIAVYEGAAVLTIVCLLYGLIMLIGGMRSKSFIVIKSHDVRPLQTLVILLIILIGVGIQIWFDSYMKTLGYTPLWPWAR